MITQDTLLEAKFNNLCSHYKDTYDIHLSSIKQRDMLFYALLLISALFSLQTVSSDFTNGIITDFLSKQVGISIDKKSNLLSSVLWFLLFGTSIKYYQVVILIEKQYSYIHGLEEILSVYYENTIAFTREGKSYLNGYSILSNWAYITYTLIFPILIIYCIWLKITGEITYAKELYSYILTDFICYLLIGLSSSLYLIKIHEPLFIIIISKISGIVIRVRTFFNI